MRLLARRAAPAWDSPYRSASLRCTAAGSGSSRNLAAAPHSSFTLPVVVERQAETALCANRFPRHATARHSRHEKFLTKRNSPLTRFSLTGFAKMEVFMRRKFAIVLAGCLLMVGISAASATSMSQPTKASTAAQVQKINGHNSRLAERNAR
jgi:hypothetical protein